MLKITTWNVNSIRSRLETLSKVADRLSPDVLCLQEIKVTNDLFPATEIADLGYPHQAVYGMKAYNGVAILSKEPLQHSGQLDWCDKNDARHIFAILRGNIEIHNIYVPAGGDLPDPKLNNKFDHKLKFLRALTRWGKANQDSNLRRILVGDLNIAPLETDVWSHKQLLKVVSHSPTEVALLEKLRNSAPWRDAVRHIIPPQEPLYSWWSYRSKNWSDADKGRRLDHIWVTDQLVDAVVDAIVLREARGWDKPSDHVPVTVTLDV